MNIPTLRDATNKLEDSIITISGPALAISGILAGVDLLMGGAVMTHIGLFSWAWAIALMISLDFQVLSLGARAHKVYLSDKRTRRKVGEIALALLISVGISYVSVQMQSIIARANSVPGLSITDATTQLGINPVWLTWERSALVLLLIFLSGWFREEVVPAGNNTAISEDTMRAILTRLEKLDHLERVLQEQTVTVVPESGTNLFLPGTQAGTGPETETLDQPPALFPAVPGVSPDEVQRVIGAYQDGIPKREICTHLRWGKNKYTTKVKPVLDVFLGREQTGRERETV